MRSKTCIYKRGRYRKPRRGFLIVSILVFLDYFATNLFLERKALPKELYFASHRVPVFFISGEGIGNPEHCFWVNLCFLRLSCNSSFVCSRTPDKPEFQSLFSWTLLQPSKFYSIPIFGYVLTLFISCLLYTSPSPRDRTRSRMPSSA